VGLHPAWFAVGAEHGFTVFSQAGQAEGGQAHDHIAGGDVEIVSGGNQIQRNSDQPDGRRLLISFPDLTHLLLARLHFNYL